MCDFAKFRFLNLPGLELVEVVRDIPSPNPT